MNPAKKKKLKKRKTAKSLVWCCASDVFKKKLTANKKSYQHQLQASVFSLGAKHSPHAVLQASLHFYVNGMMPPSICHQEGNPQL